MEGDGAGAIPVKSIGAIIGWYLHACLIFIAAITIMHVFTETVYAHLNDESFAIRYTFTIVW